MMLKSLWPEGSALGGKSAQGWGQILLGVKANLKVDGDSEIKKTKLVIKKGISKKKINHPSS